MTGDKLDEFLRRGRELDAKATPAPWERFHDRDPGHTCNCGQIWGGEDIILMPPGPNEYEHPQNNPDDGRLTVFARNHWSALLDVVESVPSLLRQFDVNHFGSCPALIDDDMAKCDCGAGDRRAAFDRAEKALDRLAAAGGE